MDGDTGAVGGLPIGTTCHAVGGRPAAHQGRQLRLGHRDLDPSSSVTIVKNDASNVVAVVLNNPHRTGCWVASR